METSQSEPVPITLTGTSKAVIDRLNSDPKLSKFLFTYSSYAPSNGHHINASSNFDVDLSSRAQLSTLWHVAPYVITVNVVLRYEGSRAADSAVISNQGSFSSFVANVDSVVTLLITDLLRGRSRAATTYSPKIKRSLLPIRGPLDWIQSTIANRLAFEYWSIGWSNSSLEDVVETHNLDEVRWFFSSPRAEFIADPFHWPRTNLLLCEEAPLVGPFGRIVAFEVGEDKLIRHQTILQTERHHSYPCAFLHNDDCYLVPEDLVGGTTIYQLNDDGRLTVVNHIGSNKRLADPTIFFYNNIFWLFYSDPDFGTNDNLCILYSDSLDGEWHRHRLNPVKIDVRSCRPAGALFIVNGEIYRPAQNCAGSYGASLSLNKIDVLTPAEFKEKTVAEILPQAGPFPDGLHTLNSAGNGVWIDGKVVVYDWPNIARRLLRRTKSLVVRTK
jgi:hypothetical protein